MAGPPSYAALAAAVDNNREANPRTYERRGPATLRHPSWLGRRVAFAHPQHEIAALSLYVLRRERSLALREPPEPWFSRCPARRSQRAARRDWMSGAYA